MLFAYKVKDKTGRTIKGTTEAHDIAEAGQSLRDQNLFTIDLRPANTNFNLANIFKKKVSIKDKIIFTKQLGVMTRSGLSLIEALEALEKECENENFAKQIKKMVSDIKGGAPLSKAMENHKDTFNDIYVNMIKSGEKSGKVEMVLDRLAAQLEKDYDLNRKIKGALSYPIFILLALVVVAVLVLTYIIPQLTLIFEDAGVELPAITRFIIALSASLKNYGVYYLLVIAVIVISVMQFKKTKAGISFYDGLITRIPVFGTLLKKTYMARFTRNFAALSSSGLPLIEVFKITADTIGNVHYKKEIDEMAYKVKSGKSISSSIKESELFPPMVGQLSSVGEKSGSVDEVFDTLADFYDKDIDNITSNFSALLEPVIMLVLGAGVGFLVIAVLQPIYGLVNAI